MERLGMLPAGNASSLSFFTLSPLDGGGIE